MRFLGDTTHRYNKSLMLLEFVILQAVRKLIEAKQLESTIH